MNQNIFEGENQGIDRAIDDFEAMPTSLSESRTASLEDELRKFEAKERYEFKKHGLKLIIGCLSCYFIILVLDSVLKNIFSGWETSDLTTNFVELLKFLISSLIGFVFSETKSKNE